jgi:hypothetical protein
MTPDVEIEWRQVESLPPRPGILDRLRGYIHREDVGCVEFEDGDPWMTTRVLYAYLDPEDGEIMYVGKAWSTTVYDRFVASDKGDLWEHLEQEYGLVPDDLNIIVGFPKFPSKGRLTKELLADLESLLIYHIEPPGNIQSKHSRIGREGLVCICTGDWLQKRKTFVDE